jgi:glycosyltransferase involved in cell wall biosynthesis
LFGKLTETGTLVTWLFSDVPPQTPIENTIRIKVWNGIENIFGIPVPIPRPASVIKIWKAVKNVQLVHIHDVMYFNSLLAGLFAKLLGKNLVTTLHIWKVPYQNPFVRLIQEISHGLFGQFCLRNSEAIISVNRLTFEESKKFKDAKIAFIPNGISDAFLQSEYEMSSETQSQLRLSLGLPKYRQIALFAGRFVEKKGLLSIRMLAHSFPEVLFLLCGRGTIHPTEWGLKNLRVLGQKSPVELKRLFYASDIFLLPSVGEGFPLVIQEAMACGLPCFLLRETWQSWGEGEEFFVIAQNDRLVTTFKSYFDCPFTWARRERIREYARLNWDWDKSLEQYLKIYREILIPTL